MFVSICDKLNRVSFVAAVRLGLVPPLPAPEPVRPITESRLLATATPQELFDYGAYHLLTQRVVCRHPVSQRCIYTTKGIGSSPLLYCGAGCFVQDLELDTMTNRAEWRQLVKEMQIKLPEANNSLISRLQKIHDSMLPKQWASGLIMLAARNDLDPAVVFQYDHTWGTSRLFT